MDIAKAMRNSSLINVQTMLAVYVHRFAQATYMYNYYHQDDDISTCVCVCVQIEVLCKEEAEFSYALRYIHIIPSLSLISMHTQTPLLSSIQPTEESSEVAALSVTLCGRLQSRTLRLMDLHSLSPLDCVTFDPTYYDTTTSRCRVCTGSVLYMHHVCSIIFIHRIICTVYVFYGCCIHTHTFCILCISSLNPRLPPCILTLDLRCVQVQRSKEHWRQRVWERD